MKHNSDRGFIMEVEIWLAAVVSAGDRVEIYVWEKNAVRPVKRNKCLVSFLCELMMYSGMSIYQTLSQCSFNFNSTFHNSKSYKLKRRRFKEQRWCGLVELKRPERA